MIGLFYLLMNNVYAQNKKEDTLAAIKSRLSTDITYAQSKRSAFNRGTWIGSTLTELIKKWGAPSRIISDGGNGKIAIYSSSQVNAGGSVTPGYTTYNGLGQVVDYKATVDTRWSKEYTESTQIFANEKGIVTDIKYNNSYH